MPAQGVKALKANSLTHKPYRVLPHQTRWNPTLPIGSDREKNTVSQ